MFYVEVELYFMACENNDFFPQNKVIKPSLVYYVV